MMPPRPTRPCGHAFALLAGCVAGLLAACPAAGAGLSIGWRDCRPPLGSGFVNQSFGCASDIQEFPLFPSFSLPASMDSVYSMELVIDIAAAADSLPAWWLMAPGSCRTNGWAADDAPLSSCTDAWGGLGTGSFQGWIPGTPGGASNHARLLVAVGTLPQDAVTLLGNATYTACRVLLRTNNTVACNDGCSTPVCMVFNSLLVRRLHFPADEEVLVSGPDSGGSDQVVWQSDSIAHCAAVPVRRRTWGAVKALYR